MGFPYFRRLIALSQLIVGLLALAFVSGCTGETCPAIRVEGSDTMVNVAQAWAEQYRRSHPHISVQVLGGGSGVGIASLIDDNCDLATASRRMKDKEIQKATSNRGEAPREYIVGYDALAVYVHRDLPLDSISLEELAEIFGEGGTVGHWSQLGVDASSKRFTCIVRVNRQNSSGTYVYFREAVMGKRRDYRMGTIDQSGSKDVVALISHTPCAIGYSGMGYRQPGTKMLKISRRRGEPGVAPTVENARNGTYPITRPLLVYSAGEPCEMVKEFLDWVLSPPGQKVVREVGFVPVRGE
jgi:phosphate transport system substrate-binding protein